MLTDKKVSSIMNELSFLDINSENAAEIAEFLGNEHGLIPLIKKISKDCFCVYPGSTLVLDMINDCGTRKLGLLIKCLPEQRASAMDAFFEFEQKGWGDLMFDYSDIFIVDLYGFHCFRAEEI